VLLSSTTVAIGLVSFTPGGKQIAYYRGTPSSGGIDVMTLATSAVTSVLGLRGKTAFVDGLAWTPDGTDLIVGTNEVPGTSHSHTQSALWRVPVTGGTPQRLTAYDDAGSVSVAPDGSILYSVSETFSSGIYQSSALWTCAADGSDRRRLLDSARFVYQLSVSPDGQSVLITVATDDTTSHIERVAVNGSAVTSLTPAINGRADLSPSWTPDGTDVVFLSSRAGRHEGSKTHQLLDAYLMTGTGTGVTKEIAYEGTKESVEVVSWGT
jgi:Tol biopolymer transport system component